MGLRNFRLLQGSHAENRKEYHAGNGDGAPVIVSSPHNLEKMFKGKFQALGSKALAVHDAEVEAVEEEAAEARQEDINDRNANKQFDIPTKLAKKITVYDKGGSWFDVLGADNEALNPTGLHGAKKVQDFIDKLAE